VISELVRPRPSETVLSWLANTPKASLFLSVLTLGEVQKGIAKLPPSEKRDRLQRWIEGDLVEHFHGRILTITPDVALRWGAIAGEADRRGQRLPVVDGLLAATALHDGLTVVTRNTVDLVRAGVRVLNPWQTV
jgi:predicted nucleic acid-binding protein